MAFDVFLVLPVFFLVFLGWLSRELRFTDKNFAKTILAVTINFFVPAVAFLAVSKISLSPSDVFVPLAAALFMLFMFVYGVFFSPRLKLGRSDDGVFKSSLMIPNTYFVLLFALALWPQEGVENIFIFELASLPIIFSLVYYVTIKDSPLKSERKVSLLQIVAKLFTFPPFLASFAGLLLVLSHQTVPSQVTLLLSPLAAAALPLLAFATGVLFETKIKKPKLVAITVFSKMAVGFVLGFGLAYAFGLVGFAKAVVIAACASPTGFNAVAFAAKEHLDLDYAASCFFVSVAIGLIAVPAILILFA